MVKSGGTITVIEGDHGSAFFHPESREAREAIRCLIELQARAGGDSLIGRRLQPILSHAGFRQVRVSPRLVYADASLPHLVDGFTRKTFIAMVEGVKEEAVGQGLIDGASWERGIAALYRTAETGGSDARTGRAGGWPAGGGLACAGSRHLTIGDRGGVPWSLRWRSAGIPCGPRRTPPAGWPARRYRRSPAPSKQPADQPEPWSVRCGQPCRTVRPGPSPSSAGWPEGVC